MCSSCFCSKHFIRCSVSLVHILNCHIWWIDSLRVFKQSGVVVVVYYKLSLKVLYLGSLIFNYNRTFICVVEISFYYGNKIVTIKKKLSALFIQKDSEKSETFAVTHLLDTDMVKLIFKITITCKVRYIRLYQQIFTSKAFISKIGALRDSPGVWYTLPSIDP